MTIWYEPQKYRERQSCNAREGTSSKSNEWKMGLEGAGSGKSMQIESVSTRLFFEDGAVCPRKNAWKFQESIDIFVALGFRDAEASGYKL